MLIYPVFVFVLIVWSLSTSSLDFIYRVELRQITHVCTLQVLTAPAGVREPAV